jgi:HPt (histidine-containing phosphotransfer) domain-containing protein
MMQTKKLNLSATKNDDGLWDDDRVMSCCLLISKSSYHKIVVDFFEKNHRVDFLIKALEDENSSVILQECHALKGATSMIGLTGFNGLLESIEQSADREDFLNKKEIIENLKNILNRSKAKFYKDNQSKE